MNHEAPGDAASPVKAEKKTKDPESGKSDKKRVGVYICHCGGNISDVVDVESVRKHLEDDETTVVARRNMFMCSSDGQAMIEEDFRNGVVDSVVVASCTPKLHELTFRNAIKRAGGNPFMLEQANIREQVSWTHTHDKEAATRKAKNLVTAAARKASLLQPLDFIRVKTVQRGLVVGGGVAGLRAAKDLADRGLDVVLLEKSPFLGGKVAQWPRIYPTEDTGKELVDQLAREVLDDDRITVHLNAEPVDGGGSLGDYWLKVRQVSRGCDRPMDLATLTEATRDLPKDIENAFDFGLSKRRAVWMPYDGCHPSVPAVDWEHLPSDAAERLRGDGFDLERREKAFTIQGGTLILATGFDPYEPRPGEYGYGETPHVVTLPQLLRMLDPIGPTQGRLEVDGKPVRDVGFIHCVGSRQVEGVHEPQEDGKVNTYCSRVCCTASLHAQSEIKEYFPDTQIYDLYQDIRTYGRGHEDYYVAASKNNVLFFRYEGADPPVVTHPSGDRPVAIRVRDGLTRGEELEMGVDLLVLAVGIMPHPVPDLIEAFKLPRGSDRFLQEVHPKLRPVEMAVEGILVAGTCQAPMTIDEATSAASATAAKATNVLGKEYVELNPYVARVDPDLCQACGKCVTECSAVGAIRMSDTDGGKQVAEVNVTTCNGCGMCVAACPHDAIDVNGWTVPQFKAIVAGLLASEEEGQETPMKKEVTA